MRRIVVQNPRHRHPGLRLLRGVIFLLVMCIPVPPLLVLGVYVYYARDLPELGPIDDWYAEMSPPTTFHAADGQLVGEFFDERRLFVPLDAMPVTLIQAFLAAEDERFFEHDGIDPRSIIRAAVTNLTAGRVVQGASTLTQQLAKAMLTREKSYERKVREAILARRMEDVYEKSEILTLYLNEIFLGHNSYGVQAASQNYFRKDVSALTLAEAAILAVLPPSPSVVNPVRNLKKTLERREHVLNKMVELGFVTAAAADAARAEVPAIYPLVDELRSRMPVVVESARKRLRELIASPDDAPDDATWRRGYRVELTAELDLQQQAGDTVYDALRELDRKQGYRGPIAQVTDGDAEAFFERAERYYQSAGLLDSEGIVASAHYLARVQSVGKDTVTVQLTASVSGTLHARDMGWAGAYHDGTEEGQRPSWKPRLGPLADTFSPGDVVLVQAGEDGDALVLSQEPKVQGAALTWDPWTGYVRAMVGSSDFDRSQVNRAFSLRQTGSTMKPVYYALAYDLGLRPSYPMSDAPYRRGDFQSTGGANDAGSMLVWNGLATSRNTVSLRVSEYVSHALRLPAHRERSLAGWSDALGLGRALEGHRAEILGGDETLWDMSGAYGRFLTGGLEPGATFIRRITRGGRVLLDHTHFGDAGLGPQETLAAMARQVYRRKRRVLRQSVAFLMRHNLRGVVTKGTATRARKLRPMVAGKTGSLPYDIWFNGFSPHLVTTTWVGSDRRERILGRSKEKAGVYGADQPLALFMAITELASRTRLAATNETDTFLKPVPPSIEMVSVDPRTGSRTMDGAAGVTLPHRQSTVPLHVHKGDASTDDIHHSEMDF